MKYILINQCKSMEILFSQNDSKEKNRFSFQCRNKTNQANIFKKTYGIFYYKDFYIKMN